MGGQLIIPLVQSQSDIWLALMSTPALRNINIVLWRKLRIESEIGISALWQTPRNGVSGAGILIEMPRWEYLNPNVPGGDARFIFPITVVEEPNVNFTPGSGTLLSAEDVSQLVIDALDGAQILDFGELTAARDCMKPSTEPAFQSLVAYDLQLQAMITRSITRRCDPPTISQVGQTLVLTNGANTPNAAIYYTLDGSFPSGPDAQLPDPATPGSWKAANPNSLLYLDPITVASGSTVNLRWSAHQGPEFNQSYVGSAQVTAP
jgi:hypothetical protein